MAATSGNRSKVDGQMKQRVHQTLTDELTVEPSSGSGSSPTSQSRWLEEEEEEEDVKEMKGNSLVNHDAKNNFDHRFKSVGQLNNADETGSASTGPVFSDQDQVQPSAYFPFEQLFFLIFFLLSPI